MFKGHMKLKFAAVLFIDFLPFAIVITAVFLTIYVTVQQNFRTGANDPQIELAENYAIALSSGESLESFTLGKTVDVSESLAPFVVFYDGAGGPIQGSGKLHGSYPIPPSGVFEVTREYGENQLTWQPEASVRIATVVTHYKNQNKEGFVLVGRSLREVEIREGNLTFMVGLAFLCTFGAVFLSVLFGVFLKRFWFL
jgi:hypothetical protein